MDRQAEALAKIDAAIRVIPDFPQPGIMFRDISPLLANPVAFALAQSLLLERAQTLAPDVIIAVEARGFLFGAPLALDLAVPLVPVRKPGKLPGATHSIAYGLEYGTDRLEIHSDALVAGRRVLLIDDLLATGGTVNAAAALARQIGADVVGALFLIELDGLGGATRLADAGIPVSALLHY
jgi:adenine phosphoribosyltransferase